MDEHALAVAIKEGRVAGAGIDVFATEPCTDSPLFDLDSVVVTPHLGASTVEAQDKAGLAVARSVKLALQGEFVPDAVNVQAGGVVAEEVRPALPLVEKLGRVFTALAGGVASTLDVEVRGEIAALDVKVLQLAALKGVFADVVSEAVTYVNAPLLARDRGLEVRLTTSPDSPDYRNLITVRGTLPTGEQVSVSGTLTGVRHIEKLTEIDGFDLEIPAGGAHGLLPVRRPARHRRHRRPHPRRGRGQHRRHAGQPAQPGRRSADGAHRRLRHPARGPGRDRDRDRVAAYPRCRPGSLTAPSRGCAGCPTVAGRALQ